MPNRNNKSAKDEYIDNQTRKMLVEQSCKDFNRRREIVMMAESLYLSWVNDPANATLPSDRALAYARKSTELARVFFDTIEEEYPEIDGPY
jgi:hypothetical protein